MCGPSPRAEFEVDAGAEMFSSKLQWSPLVPPQLPTVVQEPFGKSTKRYSILAVQFCAKAYSSPAPTVQPVSTPLSKVDGGLRAGLDIAEGCAGGAVKEDAVEGIANAAAYRSEPLALGLAGYRRC